MKNLPFSSSYCRRKLCIQLIIGLMLACSLPVNGTQLLNSVPRLSSNIAVASAGFFRLNWETDAKLVELQEAKNPSFQDPHSVYFGPDRATVISGKSNGTWYYRVRAANDTQTGPWSEPVPVVVAHHSLSRALAVLSIGIVVFLATVLMIIRRTEKSE